MIELKKALKTREKEIFLKGRWFDLTYNEGKEVLHYQARDAFAPCGYIAFQTVEIWGDING